jgi:hypothetical protein
MMGNLIIHPLVFLDPALLVLLQAQRSMMDGSSTVPTTRRQVRIIGSAEQRGTRKTAFLLTDPNSLCFFFETRWIPIPIPDPQLHPRSHAWAWCIHVAVSLDDPCSSQTRNNHLPVEYATIMTFNPSLSFPKLHGLNMSGFRHSENCITPWTSEPAGSVLVQPQAGESEHRTAAAAAPRIQWSEQAGSNGFAAA